jgi:hypothetical protein
LATPIWRDGGTALRLDDLRAASAGWLSVPRGYNRIFGWGTPLDPRKESPGSPEGVAAVTPVSAGIRQTGRGFQRSSHFATFRAKLARGYSILPGAGL